MAQTHYVKKRQVSTFRRKDENGQLMKDEHGKQLYEQRETRLNCTRCGQPIEYGQPYKWFKMKTTYGGIKKSFHPDCQILASDRTTSRMGQIWDAQPDIGAAETVSDIQAELQSFAEVVRSVSEEYTESADNMESGFGHSTYQSDELREKGEALESWADELENWSFNGDEEPTQDEGESDDDYEQRVEDWRQEIRDEAQGEVDNCPV